MTLSLGTRLGPYEILAKLGEGGMGEVWRARDLQLGRDVALKVLPEGFTADPERLARFEREAKVLAALNHPNVAQIYGLETSGDTRALVMELVEGPTLAERLESGPLPLDESLSVSLQIAQALEEAHEKGIVHRDLKPQNIKASIEGKVKVLDFGLAKAMDPVGGSGSAADFARSPTLLNSPTLTAVQGTQLGVILGTAAYMAPEQARGAAIDKRADIWAFGVVLHEMLTGRRLFLADSVPDTLAAVLRAEIDLATLPESTPPAIRRLLRRCLERNPRNRLHDIADARIVIEEVLGGRIEEPRAAAAPAAAAPVARKVVWITWLRWVVGIALGALAIAVVDRTLLAPQPPVPPRISPLTYSGASSFPSVSPDGNTIAFASSRDGRSRIWVKQLTTGEEVAITEGPDGSPRVSPDGSSILFARGEGSTLSLFRVPLVGGTPRRLARNLSLGAGVWSPDGKQIALARTDGDRDRVVLLPADGGAERVVATLDDVVVNLVWSPDGRRLALGTNPRTNFAARQAILLVDVVSGELKTVRAFSGGNLHQGLAWDGDRALLYAWAASQAGRGPFELRRIEVESGEIRTLLALNALPFRIEVAGPGRLVLDSPELRQNLVEAKIGERAAPRIVTRGPTIERQPAFSPDGKRVVFTSDRSGSLDLWVVERESGAVRRLTYDAADDWDSQFTPDGKHLAWSSNRSGNFEVWIAEPDGSGARQVTADGVDAENPTLSADGEWLVYSSSNPKGLGIWKIRPDGRDATLLLKGNYTIPELSPRVGWIAAIDGATLGGAITEVVVVRLDDGAEVARIEVGKSLSATTVGRARWLPDGRTLLFVASDGDGNFRLESQPIEPGRDTSSQRRVVFTGDANAAPESFAVSPDGEHLMVSMASGSSDLVLVEGLAGVGEERRR